MNDKISKKQITALLGSPGEIDQELREFRKSAQLLSSDRPRLIEEFPQRWVAIYKGEVRLNSSSFSQLLTLIDEENIPRSSVIVRFIDKNIKTLVLQCRCSKADSGTQPAAPMWKAKSGFPNLEL